jgi:hypothetical protein
MDSENVIVIEVLGERQKVIVAEPSQAKSMPETWFLLFGMLFRGVLLAKRK